MTSDKSQNTEPLTCDQAAAMRADCEAQLQALLVQLCERTGLDLLGVTVRTVVTVHDTRDEPHQVPLSVRIDLGV